MKEIIEPFNKRDEQALELIFRVTYREIVYYAVKYLGDIDEAEDIAMISYIKLWDSDSTFDSFEKIRIYLYKCVRSMCLNKLKSIKRKGRAVDLIMDIKDNTYDAEEIIKNIHSLINKLPEHYGKLLKLEIEGYSLKEIGIMLRMPMNTLYIKRHRAIKLLKSWIVNL